MSLISKHTVASGYTAVVRIENNNAAYQDGLTSSLRSVMVLLFKHALLFLDIKIGKVCLQVATLRCYDFKVLAVSLLRKGGLLLLARKVHKNERLLYVKMNSGLHALKSLLLMHTLLLLAVKLR